MSKRHLLLPLLILFAFSSCRDCISIKEGLMMRKKCCDKRDLQTGYVNCRIFDSTGTLIEIGDFKDTLKVGFHKYYENGKLYAIVEYVIVEDSISYHNRDYSISSTGDTITAESSYYTITYQDTIDLGDTLKARISIDAPSFKNSKLELWAKETNGQDNTRLIRSDGLSINYFFIPINRGFQTIVCELNEHEFQLQNNNSSPTGKFRKFFAKFSFFVK